MATHDSKTLDAHDNTIFYRLSFNHIKHIDSMNDSIEKGTRVLDVDSPTKSTCDVICEQGKFDSSIRATLYKAKEVLAERRLKDPNGIYYLKDVATGVILGI